MNSRKHELDWLRVTAILVVFLYHTMRFFDLDNWQIKNADTYLYVEMLTHFIERWMMPLFFVISGASLYYLLKKRGSWSRFYVGKFHRLMIPVVVATLTHSALQVYLEKLTHGTFSGSFWEFLPNYFSGVYLYIGSPGNFPFHGMHLWYLWILFIYTLLCYGLFAWLTGSGRKLLESIGRVVATPGLIYIWLSCPLFLLYLTVPKPVLLVGQGGWGFFFYLWFLIAGFIIYSSEPLQRLIKSQRWVSLGLAVILSAIYLYYRFTPTDPSLVKTSYDLTSAVFSFLSSWTCLLAILGFGMRYLDFDRPSLPSLNEGVLPFYILHQTIIQVIGLFVIQWNMDDFLKWVFIVLSSFVSIMVIYLALIRQSQALRFLFGMNSDGALARWFAKPIPLISVHLLYVGLIVLAVFNGET